MGVYMLDNNDLENQLAGSITLTFTGIKLLPFLNILLSYGKCAQPLAPKKLVDLWEENIQACADKI